LTAWALLVLGLPLLTFVLEAVRGSVSLESVLLLYLMVVVSVAALGGIMPGLAAALAADLLANYFFVPPYGTLHIQAQDHLVALLVFVAVAAVVSILVELASRRREDAARNRAEADLLARLSRTPVGQVSTENVLDDIRRTFGMAQVQLQTVDPQAGWRTVSSSGEPAP